MKYTREDGCRAWLTYGVFQADRLNELFDLYGNAELIYERFMKEGGSFLRKYTNEYGVEQLKEQSSKAKMHEMMLTMQRLDIGIMAQSDDIYPDSLRNLQSPPALLFYRGNPECLYGKCISVVGSRLASLKGLEATKKLCEELSRCGVTIISGLAMGIDTAAHEGCLAGGSPTVAILGCGIDVDYPVENVELKERIVKGNGLLLSEYPPGVKANRFVFQARNRIISGLSKALLMMESRIQSGSMVTVHHALDQGREVYAYPGLPGTEWAEGAHQLLREGANYFTSAQDILDDMGWRMEEKRTQVQPKQETPHLNDEQRLVYKCLHQGDLSFDQLAEKTSLKTSSLSVALTMLQMMGLVKAMPGKMYSRI